MLISDYEQNSNWNRSQWMSMKKQILLYLCTYFLSHQSHSPKKLTAINYLRFSLVYFDHHRMISKSLELEDDTSKILCVHEIKTVQPTEHILKISKRIVRKLRRLANRWRVVFSVTSSKRCCYEIYVKIQTVIMKWNIQGLIKR